MDVHRELLSSLKTIVEGLLSCQVANVWNVYGGLNRLHAILGRILKHGFKIFKDNGEEDLWRFMEGLQWLEPSLASSPTPVSASSPPHHQHTDPPLVWLHNSLETHSLSEKLSWLLSDLSHLDSCYERTAFLRQRQFSEAMLVCLKAVEQNRLSLLSEINPALYYIGHQEKMHRRCSSLPVSLRRETPQSAGGERGLLVTACHQRDPVGTPPTYTSSAGSPRRRELSLPVLSPVHQPSDNRVDPRLTSEEALSPVAASSVRGPQEEEVEPATAAGLLSSPPPPATAAGLLSPPPPATAAGLLSPPPTATAAGLLSPPPTATAAGLLSAPATAGLLSPSPPPAAAAAGLASPPPPAAAAGLASPPPPATAAGLLSSPPPATAAGLASPPPPAAAAAGLASPPPPAAAAGLLSSPPPTAVRRLPKRLVPPTSSSSEEGVTAYRGASRVKKKSFIEDGGGRSILPMRMGSIARPRRGQSLTSFLRSKLFANAELDRENAHFSVSEAIIAAIEQVKWEVTVEEESDEDIRQLKEKLRERRRKRELEKQRPPPPPPLLSDSGGGELSPSPVSSASGGGSTESLSTDDQTALDEGVVVSGGDTGAGGGGGSGSGSLSAEGVALALLSKFSGRHLPKASEIVWLVSEEDAPQQLLPLPESITASAPDEDMQTATELRGTSVWAPPRPQVIFTVHPSQRRASVMGKQKFRCAGCGMKIAEEHLARLRYCEYLGRYFCTGCHSGSATFIPGRILAKWDFSKFPVSNFSYKLLEGMHSDPLFCPEDVNPLLYRRVKPLERLRALRVRLKYLKEFLLNVNCRYAADVCREFKKEADYMIDDGEIYSLEDLLQVKSGKLLERLRRLAASGLGHVTSCQLCQARGFLCEICRSPEPLFPWELSKAVRCSGCGSLRHLGCVSAAAPPASAACPKCLRRLARSKAEEGQVG